MSATTAPRPYLLAALLAFAVAATYWVALSGGFVYDDLLLVADRSELASAGGLLDALKSSYWSFDEPGGAQSVGYWRPLTTLALALGRWVGKGAPVGFHAVSLGLHLVASLLAWRLAARFIKTPALAWFAGLLFGLHPVHVQSVAWISAVNDPLFAVFALAAIDAFVVWRQRAAAGLPLAAGAWLFLALLAKEQALAVPVMMMTIDLALPRPPGGRRWSRAFAPALAVLAGYVALRIWVFGDVLAGFDRQAADLRLSGMRIATYWVELFGGFLGLLALPADLTVFRSVRPVLPGWSDPAFVAGCASLAVWTAALWFTWRTARRHAFVALLLIPAAIWPVLASFQSAGAFPLSDRYLYLAVAPWCVLLAGVVGTVAPRGVAMLVLGAVALVYGWKSYDQTRLYANDETFFRAAAAASPRSPYVHWGLGRVLLERYQVERDKPLLDEAFLHFLTSLYLGTDYGRTPQLGEDAPLNDRVSELNAIVNDTAASERRPDPTVMVSRGDREQANIGLGWCYLFLADLPPERDLRTPEIVFEQTIRLFPESYRALTGLGATQLEMGKVEESVATFERALEIHPRYAPAWHNLAQAHIRSGDWPAARTAFENALEQRPGHAQDLVGIATTSIEAGDYACAEDALATLRELEPDSLEPLFWSGMSAARQRELTVALGWFDALLARERGHGRAHLERGKVLLQMNEPSQAIQALGRACELIPDSFEAHYNLGRLLLERVGLEESLSYLVRAFELAPDDELRDALHYELVRQCAGRGDVAAQLAVVSQSRGEFGQAHDWIAVAMRSGERWATSADLHHRRASCLRWLGETVEAVSAYKRSIELDGDQFWPNHDLGMLLGHMQRLPEATPYLERARELFGQLEGIDPHLESAIRSSVEQAIAGTLDFSGPNLIPIEAGDLPDKWK